MNKPRTVWRVERDNGGNGLMARGYPDFQDDWDFELQRQRHLNWDRQFESPFISTFSSKAHVIWWGRRQADLWGTAYYDSAVVYKISTTYLQMAYGRQDDEYLIVGEIPQDCIQRMTNLRDEVERMLDGRFRPENEWFGDEYNFEFGE
ncbi:hypothetical protein FI667_g13429, partial [Globisporangium splendens]